MIMRTEEGRRGIMSILCPCFAGSKEEPCEPTSQREEEQKSPFLGKKKVQISDCVQNAKSESAAQRVIRKISAAKKRDQSLTPTARNKRKVEEFEFDRHSNASSLHQIPSLYTEADLGPNREASSGSKHGGGGGRSIASRYSVDDVGSFRSVLKIDRTPSLSYCSEAGVAKSSSILVNIPSSRGSLTSFGRWSSTRRSPSPEGVRKGSLTPSTATEANLSLSRQHINRVELHHRNTLSTSPSWSTRNVNQDRK